MYAIDFFCGGGGMTRGLLDANIEVLLGIDNNPCCVKTYEMNNGIRCLTENIMDITKERLEHECKEIKDSNNLLLVGCAPCQPFSILNPNNPEEHISVNLLNEFGRLVKDLHPAHILVENVASIGRRGGAILNRFKSMLESEGYEYAESIVNAKEYGVPQNRKRYILIASRLFKPQIPEATFGTEKRPFRTVKDVIEKYPPIEAGESSDVIPNHRAAKISELNYKRIKNTPHDGGSRTDWPHDLWLNCHQNFSGHSDVYGRMKWDSVSPTLTSKCYSLSNGRFGHPAQNRAISLREAAALQTFPDEYIFYGSLVEIGKQIGNAVPVALAQTFGEYILKEHNKKIKKVRNGKAT